MDIFDIIYFTPLLIIGLIVYAVRERIKKRVKVKEKDWYLQSFLSKEDAVSQFFFLLSVFFLGVTLLAFNKDLGNPLSWRTILLFASIIGVVIGYYFKVIYTLTVSLIGFAVWWGFQAAEWIGVKDIKYTALFTGLLFIVTIFYLLGRVHAKEIKFKRVSMIYSVPGFILITGALFSLSTQYGLRMLEEITRGTSFLGSWEITFSLFVFLILLVGILFYTLSKNLIFKLEAAVIGFLVILFFIIALLPEQTIFLQQKDYYEVYRGTEFSSSGILWAIFFNILIFLELVGITLLGYLKQESWLVNFGVFFFFILIFVKYFDWFFTSLSKSVFFIGAGVLLFVVGWLMERGRRYLLLSMKKERVRQNQ